MIQNRPTLSAMPSSDREHVAERPVAEPAAERLIAEAELVLDDVVGIKRERQRDQYVEQHDDAEQRDEPQHRLLAGERREAGQPGVDRPGEDERHQAEIDEVDRHVGERAGERDVAVAAGLGPLLGRLFFGGGRRSAGWFSVVRHDVIVDLLSCGGRRGWRTSCRPGIRQSRHRADGRR